MKTQKEIIQEIYYGRPQSVFLPYCIILSVVSFIVVYATSMPLIRDLVGYFVDLGLKETDSAMIILVSAIFLWSMSSIFIISFFVNKHLRKRNEKWFSDRDNIVEELQINNILQVSTAGVIEGKSKSPWHYDVIGFMKNVVGDPNWQWVNNSRCKYINLRIDMRNGNFVVFDRDDNLITPMMVYYQFSKKTPTPPENYLKPDEKSS